MVLAAVAVLAAVGAFALARSLTRPPDDVWTLRAPDAPGHESLTVHDAPAGHAVAGRWVFVDGEGVDGSSDVVLVRLPLDDGDGAAALVRFLAGGEVVYRASGGTAETPGGFWYGWCRE